MVQKAHRKLSKQSSQNERLRYVDLRLRFLGSVRRQDVVSRFGLGTAAATRDMAQYKDLAPENMVYQATDKSYARGEHFAPLFTWVTPNEVLDFLGQALGHGTSFELAPLIPIDLTLVKSRIENDILATMTLAIKSKTALVIEYISSESGLTRQEILPHALADCGENHVVRAYDRKSKDFQDFALGRIKHASPKIGPVFEQERPAQDIQWNNIVQLELVAHPINVTHPEALEAEFEMVQGILCVQVRAALAGYLLKRMSVDCSERRRMRGPAYRWWLKNRQVLYGLPNLGLLPGYADVKS